MQGSEMKGIRSAVVKWRQDGRTRLLILTEIAKTHPLLVAALTILTVATALLPVAFSVSSGLLVGSIPSAVASGLHSVAGRRLLVFLVATAVLALMQQVANPVRAAIANSLGERFDTNLAKRIVAAAHAPMGIAHFEDPATLNEIARARGQIGWITAGETVGAQSSISVKYLQTIFATAVLLRLSVPLGVFLLFALLVTRQIRRRQLFRLVQVQTGQARAIRHSDYFRDLVLEPDASKETRIFGLLEWIKARFGLHWNSAMSEVWVDRRRGAGISFAAVLLKVLPSALIFLEIASRVTARHISLAAMSIYALATLNANSISELGNDEITMEFGQESVRAAVSLDDKTDSVGQLKGGSESAEGLPRSVIRFEGVSFTYPESDEPALRDLNFEIHAGQSLALVGANGAGKTTILKLLCRFYDPSSGRITVDGLDLRSLDLASWRRRVGGVFQDFAHWELSVRHNVGFGNIRRLDDLSSLNDAATRAGAYDLIDSWNEGWDTTLSRRYEGGVELSGGQWQRIGLARAMMAAGGGVGVLLMDEPTANLDARGEAQVYEQFLDLTRDLTTVLVSHRFSTVRKANRIFVLEKGGIIEDGSHEELLDLGGVYSEMFRFQASRFDEEAPAEETS